MLIMSYLDSCDKTKKECFKEELFNFAPKDCVTALFDNLAVFLRLMGESIM